jgi:hypothetical protein
MTHVHVTRGTDDLAIEVGFPDSSRDSEVTTVIWWWPFRSQALRHIKPDWLHIVIILWVPIDEVVGNRKIDGRILPAGWMLGQVYKLWTLYFHPLPNTSF